MRVTIFNQPHHIHRIRIVIGAPVFILFTVFFGRFYWQICTTRRSTKYRVFYETHFYTRYRCHSNWFPNFDLSTLCTFDVNDSRRRSCIQLNSHEIDGTLAYPCVESLQRNSWCIGRYRTGPIRYPS
ncbi:uncharacterized protein LOC120902190 [Anopheles arabiensis]|uniref:uncharacterized protein LOC120902190 n=1 Tax=Anopheles arabiensis TaxID=7173 RepID=UPI001AAC7726|nr:uncharacterized protein LOC120902190 [Anopheles arabiensis]